MAKRIVIESPDLPSHPQPFATAVRAGQMVFSSAISGREGNSLTAPDAPEKQMELAFRHMRRIVELAGGSPADIARVDIWLRDMSYRELVNREWLKMFPDENDRPVRHTTRADLASNFIVQLQFIAVV